ncbi:MAG: tRNA-dihydrouridine synthase family protein [Desulfobacteraceae bacterium]|nr:MAG: tRNA-dihydrouridine synthase family protein [Desulfobacteraceae bacterium]
MDDKQAMKQSLGQVLHIGSKAMSPRLVLAPMAGLGHIAFRHLVSEFGGFGLLFTGMCSAKAVPHENPRVSPVFCWRQEELPFLVCQIFGADPESMSRAAERIEKEGFWGVDLNFGCSVSAICKKGAGAALLKTPDQAVAIVKAVRASVSIPVCVKFRTGWDSQVDGAVELARAFEEAGADAITFHPRVAPDRRNRPPVWRHITRIKAAVSIPVFGNGNLFDEQDGNRMMGETGCDGLSIGRMAVARPWIFAQWTHGFIPDQDIYISTAFRMIELLTRHYNEVYAVKLFKKFVPYFSANFKFGHEICKKLLIAETPDEVKQRIDQVLSVYPQTVARPNQNLFL